MQEITVEKRQFIQRVVFGKLNSLRVNNEVKQSLIPHKNKLKIAQKFKYKTCYHKASQKEKHQYSILMHIYEI